MLTGNNANVVAVGESSLAQLRRDFANLSMHTWTMLGMIEGNNMAQSNPPIAQEAQNVREALNKVIEDLSDL